MRIIYYILFYVISSVFRFLLLYSTAKGPAESGGRRTITHSPLHIPSKYLVLMASPFRFLTFHRLFGIVIHDYLLSFIIALRVGSIYCITYVTYLYKYDLKGFFVWTLVFLYFDVFIIYLLLFIIKIYYLDYYRKKLFKHQNCSKSSLSTEFRMFSTKLW